MTRRGQILLPDGATVLERVLSTQILALPPPDGGTGG